VAEAEPFLPLSRLERQRTPPRMVCWVPSSSLPKLFSLTLDLGDFATGFRTKKILQLASDNALVLCGRLSRALASHG